MKVEKIAIQRPEPENKYAQDTPLINCPERIPLCQAACCKLEVCLTSQDIEEQQAVINRHYPFFVAQDNSGYCVHLEDLGYCDIYDKRPAVCREFDCSKDTRIWLDFERMIINPMILEPEWPKGIVGISAEKKQLLTARLDRYIDANLIEEPPMSERVEGSCVITGTVTKQTEKAVLLHVESERNNFWIPKSQIETIYADEDDTELEVIPQRSYSKKFNLRIPMWLSLKITHMDSVEELEEADLSYISID